MAIKAEIIAVGDELTSGQRLDTNSQWLSQQLHNMGIRVGFHATVGDELAEIESAVGIAAARSDLVIMTGGLGPTADDLTRQSLAAAADVELELDSPSLEHIKGLFKKNKRTMTPSNRLQAMFPKGSKPIPNRDGTAPGVDMELERNEGRARVFALPGVPYEMKKMWQDYVDPEIRKAFPAENPIFHFALHCFGAGESEIESRLPDIIRRGRQPQVGITASKATITLRISAAAQDESQFREMIRPTEQLIRETLGSLVFGDSGITLEHVVTGQLTELGQTIAVVDQGLGGVPAQKLHRADRRRRVLRGAWIWPEGDELSTMLKRAAELSRADWVLGVGPLFKIGGDRKRILVLQSGSEQFESEVDCLTHPDLVIERSAKQALNFVRLTLTSQLAARQEE